MESNALGKTLSLADMHNEMLTILVLSCYKSVIIKDRVLIWFMNVECVENFRNLPRFKPSLIYTCSLNNYIHCKNLPKLRKKWKIFWLTRTCILINSFNLYKNVQKCRSILELIGHTPFLKKPENVAYTHVHMYCLVMCLVANENELLIYCLHFTSNYNFCKILFKIKIFGTVVT